MCGRYALEISTEELLATFGMEGEAPTFAPHYNIAPSSQVPLVLASGISAAHWGWTVWGGTPWSGTPSDNFQINARSETIREKPSFRHDFAGGRCLLPASAFYEWQHQGERKGQPYAVRPQAGRLLAFAALQRMRGNRRECVIITTKANEKLYPIHHREPVMMKPERWHDWLCASPQEAASLLTTSEAADVELYPISMAVNNVRHNEAALLEKISLQPLAQPRLF